MNETRAGMIETRERQPWPSQIVEWLRDHDDVAHRIALEGQRFAARHLTKPARLCYLRKLLTEYGALFK